MLRILEFDIRARKLTGKSWKSVLEVARDTIGDVDTIDATRALVIERGDVEGDPRLFYEPERKSGRFPKIAEFERVYLIDRAQVNGGGSSRSSPRWICSISPIPKGSPRRVRSAAASPSRS